MTNSILCNVADFDDTHKQAMTHTGSVMVPTALTMAESLGLSRKECITSLVAGYEVADSQPGEQNGIV